MTPSHPPVAVAKSIRLEGRATTRLPLISAVTHNIHSLSAHSSSRGGVERQAKVVLCIRRLLKGRDYGLFQETWLGRLDSSALSRDFPDWLIFYSNLDRNKGGVITMIRKTVARCYNIERVHLPEAAEGRVLALRLSSLKHPNDDRAHFNLVNVYLSSGRAAMLDKLSQINTLSHVDASTHTIMGGDFNFIENAADTTGHMAGSSLSGDAKVAWTRECDRLRLWDVVQDSHTRFQSGVGGGCSARLDRFYASFSNAERTLLHIDSHPVFAGVVSARCHASLHAGLVESSLQPLIHRLSDHLPVVWG